MRNAYTQMLAVLAASISLAVVHAWGGSTNRAPHDHAHDNAPSTNRRLLFLAGGVATSTLVANSASAAPALYNPPPHSMDDKVVVITGGNTGLGLESGKRLAAAGAEVVLTSRNAKKGERAAEAIRDYLTERGVANDKISVLPLDLCDLDDVKEFPNLLKERVGGKTVDVLMNNAGVMAIQSREITKNGFERTFQTNHLGHFVLTAKLIPMLSKDARIINVSSEAWQFASAGLELDNLNGELKYDPWGSYGQSKLANILFTKELQERSNAAGRSYTVTSLHPGAVATDLGRYLVGEEKWSAMKENGMTLKEKLLFVPLSKLTKTVEDGASTQVFLSADPNIDGSVGGKYFIDCKERQLKGAPTDMIKAKELWSVSEKLGGVQFNI